MGIAHGRKTHRVLLEETVHVRLTLVHGNTNKDIPLGSIGLVEVFQHGEGLTTGHTP